MKQTICLILTLLLLLCVFSACGKDDEALPLYAERGKVEREQIDWLSPARNFEEILKSLQEAGQRVYDGPGLGNPDLGDGLRLDAAEAEAGDFAASDGSCIYLLDSYGLVIFSMDGEGSEILSYTRVARQSGGWGERLFLAPDRAAVVYTVSGDEPEGETGWEDSSEVHVVLLDTADKRAPRQIAETAVQGSLVEARLTEGQLCLVTRRSFLGLPGDGKALLPKLWENDKELSLEPMDVYLSPDPGKAAVSVVAALRLEDGRLSDAMAFAGTVDGVRGAGGELWLTRTRWNEYSSEPYREEVYRVTDCQLTAETELLHLRLEKGLRLLGGWVLDGALSDPAALSVLDGGLCAVTGRDSRSFAAYTDENHGWTNYETRESSHSSQLAMLNADMELTGSLTALGGEAGLADCRFAGGAAWLSVAGEQGMVHTVDLSDPAAPTPAGDLAVEGETLYLRDFGEGRVLCLAAPGAEGDWRLILFDLSDPTAPKALDSLKLKQRPAAELADPGAVFADPAAGLVGFPVAGEKGNQYLLVRWTGEAWKEKGSFAPEYVPDDARAFLRDGLLYICTPGEVYVADPERMQLVATVSNAVG